MKRISILAALAVVAFSLSAQSPVDTVFQQKLMEERLVDSTLSQRFDAAFYQAELAKTKKQYDLAQSLYQKCLSLDSTNASAWYELSYIYQMKDEKERAYEAIQRAIRYSKHNDRFREVEAAYLVTMKEDYKGAIKIIERLSRRNPKKTTYLYQLLDLYQATHNDKKYLSTIVKIEIQNGIQEPTSMMRVSHFYQRNKHKQAIAEIKRLQEAFPHNRQYQALLGEYYFTIGDNEMALKTIRENLEKDPNNGYLFINLLDYYMEVDNPEKVDEFMYKVLNDETVDVSEKGGRFTAYINYLFKKQDFSQNYEKTERFYKSLIDKYVQESDFYRMYALHLYYVRKDTTQAEEFLQTAISLDPSVPQNWQALGDIYAKSNDVEQLDRLAEDAIKLFPQEGVWYYYRIMVQIQNDSIDGAIALIDNAVSVLQGEQSYNFKSLFYGTKGDLLYQQSKFRETFASYDQALVYNSSNVYVLNNYAYFLAECGERLDKAEQMSSITVMAEPQNPTYLDTYAWVLFKKGNYRDAQFQMERALLYSGKEASGTLYEHYGDILFHLDEVDKAIEQWQKALEQDDASEELQEKISQRRYIEKSIDCR